MTQGEFTELMGVLRPRLLRSSVRRWGELGEDFLQEALLRTWNSLDKYDHTCSITTWVFAYAVRVAADYFRKLQPPSSEDVYEVLSNDVPLDDHVLTLQILSSAASLPRKQRKTIEALLDGASVGNRSNFRHAKRKLQEKFK